MASFSASCHISKPCLPIAALLALSLNMASCVSAEKNAGHGEFDVPVDPKMMTADETQRPAPDIATAVTTGQHDPAETAAGGGQPALPGQIMMETRVAASRRSIFASEPDGEAATQAPQTDTTMAYAAPRAMNPVQASLFGGTPVAAPQQNEATAETPAEAPIVPLAAEESQAYDDPVVTVPAKGQMQSAEPAPATVAPAEPKKKQWSLTDLFAGFHAKQSPEPVK